MRYKATTASGRGCTTTYRPWWRQALVPEGRSWVGAIVGFPDEDAHRASRLHRKSGMQGDSGRTVAPWFATAETPSRPPLPGDMHADVCVVGSGLAGLS